MNLDFGVVFSNLLGLFILIGVGFASVKLKAIPSAASRPLSALLLQITLPCTIFVSLATKDFDPAFARDSGIVIALGTIVFLALAAASVLLAKVFGVANGRRGIWAFAATFCNNGFMGFPVALALFGPDGLALAVMLNIPFSLIVYTLGIRMVCQDAGGKTSEINWVRIIFSNINIAVLLSLIFYFGQFRLPDSLIAPLTHFSNCTTPLSMFITGMALAGGKGLEFFKDKDAYTSSFLRLIAYPLVTVGFFKLIPFANPLIPGVMCIIFAMPAASVTTVLAESYHSDKDLAAKLVFVSSLFSMITLPLIAMLL